MKGNILKKRKGKERKRLRKEMKDNRGGKSKKGK